MKRLFFLLLVVCMAFPVSSQVNWQPIQTGIEYAEVCAPLTSPIGDSRIRLIRVDPQFNDIGISSASEPGQQARTASQWLSVRGYAIVANAGMFLMDGRSNVGYMRIGEHVNNPRFNTKDHAIFVASPTDSTLPPVQIIDRKCEADWESLVAKYEYASQGIRMIDCGQRNKWSQQDRIWSMVVVAIDKEGRLLFAFSRSPYSVHDFIDMLLQMRIGVYNAMYLEGGPEASLGIDTEGLEQSNFGSYETGFLENDSNKSYWAIPNVIYVKQKAVKAAQ